MDISKVVYGDTTLIDLTEDTVTADSMLSGVTAHGSNGEQIYGTMSQVTPATETPLMDGTAAVGTAIKYAREDHVHPHDSTIPTKTSDLTNDSGFVAAPSANVDEVLAYNGTTWTADKRMVILSYGSSTWTDFINAYNSNAVVYCRASSNSNPASGAQTRMAFMAYVNASPPTNVEFQYYRSVSSHTDSQQGDQVFIYKLDKNSGWSVTTRNAFTKIVAGTGLSSSYSSGTLTMSVASAYQIPAGGTTGQVLAKKTNTDRDLEWVNQSGGGSDKVMLISLTYSNYNYTSTETYDDILAAVNSGYAVIVTYNNRYYYFGYKDTSYNRLYFYRYDVSYQNVVQYYFYVYKNNGDTKWNYSNSTCSVSIPSEYKMQPVIWVEDNNDSESMATHPYVVPSSELGIFDDLSEIEGSKYPLLHYLKSTFSDSYGPTGSTDANYEEYRLVKAWTTHEWSEDYYSNIWIAHVVFGTTAIENGVVKYKTFTFEGDIWDGITYFYPTYSETSLGLAPTATGVSF